MRFLILTAALLAAPAALEAQAIDDCGTFVQDSSGFFDCLLLQTDSSGGPYQLTVSTAGYSAGDTVHVVGSINPVFPTFCWDPVGQLQVSLIEDCNPVTPFSGCGTLVAGPSGCTLFMADTGETYELEDLGGFSEGAFVLVDGLLDPAGCTVICATLDGCVSGNTIEACPVPFRRGDTNDDGAFDLADVIYGLASLFTPGAPAANCADAADLNDDGAIDVSDAIAGLTALFSGGSVPAPFGACGFDPTPDTLDCASSVCP